jgi:transcriptional regulator NrdR family protein
MKCPECGAWSLVKDTRESPTFGLMRRRECANYHRFTTQELIIAPEEIYHERKANALKAGKIARELRNRRKSS